MSCVVMLRAHYRDVPIATQALCDAGAGLSLQTVPAASLRRYVSSRKRDLVMNEIEQPTSAERKGLGSVNTESGHSLPESVIQALEDALINCRSMKCDPTTGTFRLSDPQSDSTSRSKT